MPDHNVTLCKTDSAHAAGLTTHFAHVGLVETNDLAEARCNEQIVAAARQAHPA